MSVRIEKVESVCMVMHSRPKVRNAINPESTKALFDAFISFGADDTENVAVFWGEGAVQTATPTCDLFIVYNYSTGDIGWINITTSIFNCDKFDSAPLLQIYSRAFLGLEKLKNHTHANALF